MVYWFDLVGAIFLLAGLLFLKTSLTKTKSVDTNNFIKEIYVVLGLSLSTFGGKLIEHPPAAIVFLAILIIVFYVSSKIIRALFAIFYFFKYMEIKKRKLEHI